MSRPGRPAEGGDAATPPIDDILLEILRAGPPHNQLLSPLTPYLALCGADGPVGLQLPFEHAQLLARLNRLRYRDDGSMISAAQRDAELHDLGATLARLLAQVPALVAGLQAARAGAGRPVNIRLRMSAFELGLVPFEATLSPTDVSGGGGAERQPLLLQRPVTGMTREIRRSRALAVDWNRAPRILFAFASPGGLPTVPAQDHVDALRRAIDPWIGIHATAAERLADVRRMLTVLPEASVRSIAAACRSGDYTHVHILAHGAPLPGSDGQRRFGVCLAADGDAADAQDARGAGEAGEAGETGEAGEAGEAGAGAGARARADADAGDAADAAAAAAAGAATAAGAVGGFDALPPADRLDFATPAVVVDGQRLALALAGVGGDGHRSMPPPTVVSLATCDSGNIGSVVAPGGSIAHELHAQDIPWVVASQFPLGMRASTLLTESLYAGLLAGDDPRWVMQQVRQRLRLELPQTHDWASLVAYASIPPDLAAQVDAFRGRQTRARLDVRFARMDALVAERPAASGHGEDAPPSHASGSAHGNPAAELARLGSAVRAELAAWCDEPVARDDRRQRAARLTMRAASEKRIAIAHGTWAAGDPDSRLRSEEAYRLARRYYRAACRAEPASHWAITQFLSLLATPASSPTAADLRAAASRHRRWWQTACQLAEWDAASATIGRARAWAHGSLAELQLLGAVYAGDEPTAGAGADVDAGAAAGAGVDAGAGANAIAGANTGATEPRATDLRRQAVAAECRRLCEACDDDPAEDRFPVASTLRQFRRYLDAWPRPEWNELARAAVAVLENGG